MALRAFAASHFSRGYVRGVLPVSILEVYVATEYARYAWERLVDVVEGLGGGPVGWQALRAQGWR